MMFHDTPPGSGGPAAAGRDVLDCIDATLDQLTRVTAALLVDLAQASDRGLAERLAGFTPTHQATPAELPF